MHNELIETKLVCGETLTDYAECLAESVGLGKINVIPENCFSKYRQTYRQNVWPKINSSSSAVLYIQERDSQ